MSGHLEGFKKPGRAGQFSDDTIRAIRDDDRHPAVIAEELGVTERTITRIKVYELYANVDPAVPK